MVISEMKKNVVIHGNKLSSNNFDFFIILYFSQILSNQYGACRSESGEGALSKSPSVLVLCDCLVDPSNWGS